MHNDFRSANTAGSSTTQPQAAASAHNRHTMDWNEEARILAALRLSKTGHYCWSAALTCQSA